MLCCISSFLSFLQDFSFWIVASLPVASAIFIWLKRREGHQSRRKVLLEKLQSREPKFVEHDPFGDIAKLILPTKNEEILEQRTNFCETVAFHGVDAETGSSISIKLTLTEPHRGKAKVYLQWSDKETNETYTNVNCRPDSWHAVEVTPHDQFAAGGVHFFVLEPMRRWRIVFNGMIRRESDDEVIHMRLNLIWAALHSPLNWGSKDGVSTIGSNGIKLDGFESSIVIPNGYDQWGSMFGEMNLANEESERQIYLRGLRERRFSFFSDHSKNESQIIGVSENGFHFAIYQISVFGNNNSSSSLNFGHMMIPGRGTLPLTDINIPDLSWKSDLLEKKVFAVQQDFIKILAVDRWFNIGVQMKSPASPSSKNESFKFDTTRVVADLTFNCRRGRAICILRTRNPNNSDLPGQLRLVKEVSSVSGKPLVLSLNSPDCSASSLTGGKGSSLALMMMAKDDLGENIEIPNGVCITTFGLDEQLTAFPNLKQLTMNVKEKSVILNNATSEDQRKQARKELESVCEITVEAFCLANLTTLVSAALEKELKHVFESEWFLKKFAVRSSAIGEDSTELSSAGQNDTFLGCSGKENIENAICKCWASLFAFQSVEYRRQNGQEILTGMCVVVQEMVPAESAGVLFSRNPTTGDPSQIFITSNFGLGESVVSAISEPDTLVVSNNFWTKDTRFEIKSRILGSKKTRIDMAADGSGTIEAHIDSSIVSKLSISEEIGVRLAGLARNLEKMFGNPRDIEFAIKKDTIYLLQSRPITSLNNWSDEELMHEFDTATSSKEDIFTKANTGEVMPGASTPLTISLVLDTLDVSIQKVMLQVPGNLQTFSPHLRRLLPTSHHQCFFNYIDCCLPQIDSEEINANIKAVDLAVFGHEVTSKVEINRALDRRGMVSKLTANRKLASVVKTLLQTSYWQKYGLDPKLNETQLDMDVLKGCSASQIFREITHSSNKLEKICFVHGRVSEASTVFQLIIFMTLAENAPVSSWSNDLFADAANLLASDGHEVVSAGCPTDLGALSDIIFTNQSTEEPFQRLAVDDAVSWMMNHPKVSPTYRNFIEKYGHRCLKEFDLSSKPWGEDPTPLVKTLQTMVESKSMMKGSAVGSKKTIDQKLDSLQKPIKSSTRRALRFLLPWAHGGIALRENSKSVLIQSVHSFRMAYRILAHRLCSDGFLPDPDLIFYLTHYEIGQLIRNRTPGLIQKAIRRRRLRPTWDELRFKEMNHGAPQPVNDSESIDAKNLTVAHGTPVFGGKYKGVGRVVTRLADADTIKQGDILITVSTDIGWSPYFPLLGGVATELGGLISHGAVVAREFGLPCVVGVEGATAIFTDGDIVEIDGKKGTITKCNFNI